MSVDNSTNAGFMRNLNTSDASLSCIFRTDSTGTTSSNDFVMFQRGGGSVSGYISANGASAVQFTGASDLRLKENIAPLSGELDKIMQLNPVTFNFIGETYIENGFIAQEMELVYPDAVSYLGPDREDEYKKIGGWSNTDARIVKAIQELKAELDAAKARIETLENA